VVLLGCHTTDNSDEARCMLAESDEVAMSLLVRSSLSALHCVPATPSAAVGALGFSMGASWALWLAGRVPDLVAATVTFYGTQSIDMAPATSAFLGHFAETDPFVSDDERTLFEADLRVLGKDVECHDYPGTHHWFFEADRPDYDEAAATRAWERTIAFLRDRLPTGPHRA